MQKIVFYRMWKTLTWKWSEVIFALFYSLFSWIAVFIVGLSFLRTLEKPKFFNKKPPKWL